MRTTLSASRKPPSARGAGQNLPRILTEYPCHLVLTCYPLGDLPPCVVHHRPHPPFLGTSPDLGGVCSLSNRLPQRLRYGEYLKDSNPSPISPVAR
jgi:hypothetical protein